MNPIKRIPINKLEIGMYICNWSTEKSEQGLRAKGFIRRPETIDKLKNKGVEVVYIDINKGINSRFALPIPANDNILEPKTSLEEERSKAENVYNEATSLVENLLKDVKLGNSVDVRPIEALADDINNSVLNNPNALLCLSAIREKDRYLLEHSVNVGILMGIFTRFLGYPPHEVHQLVTGALLHDIGKIKVPNHILNKPGKLTNDEWAEMKHHVVYGQQTLQNSKGISEVAMSICGLHHERLDGSGYPVGLKEDDIDIFGRLAAIVDVYDAITATRVYHSGKPPAEAMQFLTELSNDHLDRHLVNEFIRCMGVYPVGTIVELDNGKIGVVISTNPQSPNQPIVKTFYSRRYNQYTKDIVVDLSCSEVEQIIVGALDPQEFDIHHSKFL